MKSKRISILAPKTRREGDIIIKNFHPVYKRNGVLTIYINNIAHLSGTIGVVQEVVPNG